MVSQTRILQQQRRQLLSKSVRKVQKTKEQRPQVSQREIDLKSTQNFLKDKISKLNREESKLREEFAKATAEGRRGDRKALSRQINNLYSQKIEARSLLQQNVIASQQALSTRLKEVGKQGEKETQITQYNVGNRLLRNTVTNSYVKTIPSQSSSSKVQSKTTTSDIARAIQAGVSGGMSNSTYLPVTPEEYRRETGKGAVAPTNSFIITESKDVVKVGGKINPGAITTNDGISFGDTLSSIYYDPSSLTGTVDSVGRKVKEKFDTTTGAVSSFFPTSIVIERKRKQEEAAARTGKYLIKDDFRGVNSGTMIGDLIPYSEEELTGESFFAGGGISEVQRRDIRKIEYDVSIMQKKIKDNKQIEVLKEKKRLEQLVIRGDISEKDAQERLDKFVITKNKEIERSINLFIDKESEKLGSKITSLQRKNLIKTELALLPLTISTGYVLGGVTKLPVVGKAASIGLIGTGGLSIAEETASAVSEGDINRLGSIGISTAGYVIGGSLSGVGGSSKKIKVNGRTVTESEVLAAVDRSIKTVKSGNIKVETLLGKYKLDNISEIKTLAEQGAEFRVVESKLTPSSTRDAKIIPRVTSLSIEAVSRDGVVLKRFSKGIILAKGQGKVYTKAVIQKARGKLNDSGAEFFNAAEIFEFKGNELKKQKEIQTFEESKTTERQKKKDYEFTKSQIDVSMIDKNIDLTAKIKGSKTKPTPLSPPLEIKLPISMSDKVLLKLAKKRSGKVSYKSDIETINLSKTIGMKAEIGSFQKGIDSIFSTYLAGIKGSKGFSKGIIEKVTEPKSKISKERKTSYEKEQRRIYKENLKEQKKIKEESIKRTKYLEKQAKRLSKEIVKQDTAQSTPIPPASSFPAIEFVAKDVALKESSQPNRISGLPKQANFFDFKLKLSGVVENPSRLNYINKQKSIDLTKQTSKSKQSIGFINLSTLKGNIKQFESISQSPSYLSKQSIIQKQRPLTKLNSSNIGNSEFNLSTTIKPSKSPFLFYYSKSKKFQPFKKQRSIPYDVYIKKKKIADNLTKQQALNWGSYVSDNSIAARFSIRRSSGKVKEPKFNIPQNNFLINRYKFRNFKRRKGSKIPLRNSFIERRSNRLDTTGEIRQITAARLVAERKRNFFKLPKLTGTVRF